MVTSCTYWGLPKVVARKHSPTWSDVKAKLADFDRASLQGLLKDLYGVSKDNQTFLIR
jgi:hypothetical protein